MARRAHQDDSGAVLLHDPACAALLTSYRGIVPELRVCARTRGHTVLRGTTILMGEYDRADDRRAARALAAAFQGCLDAQREWRGDILQGASMVLLLGATLMLLVHVIVAAAILLVAIALVIPWPWPWRIRSRRRCLRSACAVEALRSSRINTETLDELATHLRHSSGMILPYGHRRARREVLRALRDVSGPHWPRDLPSFSATVRALLGANLVNEAARRVFCWPVQAKRTLRPH